MTIRPILAMLILILLLGACSLWVYAFYDMASTFVDEFETHPIITDELSRVIVEDENLRNIFGEPVNVRFIGAKTEYQEDEEYTIAIYQAPIYGPQNSGMIFAEIKQVGDVTSVITMQVKLESGKEIQIIP